MSKTLFFSGYCEGSGLNKYLEIYNPTDSSVNLSNYKIRGQQNGGPDFIIYTLPNITLNPGSFYLIANSGAAIAITSKADTTTNDTVCSFNGDDMRALTDSLNNIIDIIGVVSNDPGNGWSVKDQITKSTVPSATADRILIRINSVTKGNTDWTNSSENEWNVYGQDNFNYIKQSRHLLSLTDDQISPGIAIGGTFNFGATDYTTFGISSNGFIYFDTGPTSTTYNPFVDSSYKILAPFAGNLKTTAGINVVVDSTNKTTTVTFNCYSSSTSTSNTLVFGIILYWKNHSTKSNQVDYFYTSGTSQTENFSGSYYIGYSDGTVQKYISNVSGIEYMYYGGSNIKSDNIFPSNNSTFENILLLQLTTKSLVSAINTICTGVEIGGSFSFGGQSYTSFNVSSNGFIFFGTGPTGTTTNPFENTEWKILAPFAGALATTSDCVIIAIDLTERTCTITFECYVNQSNISSGDTVITFGIILYFEDHPNHPNGIDYFYTSITQENGFVGNYYIGYSDGTTSETNMIDSHNVSGGTTGIFPTPGQIRTNVLGAASYCFYPETKILTPRGEIQIQNLKIGDKILTHDNRQVSILSIYKTVKSLSKKSYTTIIKKNSLGENCPNEDLYLSKKHKIHSPQINKFTESKNVSTYKILSGIATYYNLVLENYEKDFLVANGVIAESLAQTFNSLGQNKSKVLTL